MFALANYLGVLVRRFTARVFMQVYTRRQFASLLGLAAAAGAFGALGCSSAASQDQAGSSSQDASSWLEEDPKSATLFVFDTVVELRAYCSQELMDQAVERCNYFEERFSRTLEGSDVWNVNHAAGKPTQVAQETADIITQSLAYCEASEGLFDITIGAVSSLWDFVEGVKPDDADIKEAIKHIDYRGVTVDGTTVTLADPKAMLDLGGTAKGYIADALKTLFTQGGCVSGVLNLGGHVCLIGFKPDGSDWNVGVQDPNDDEQATIASIKRSDMSVVTSGLYERQFKADDGKTYYHILDPKTGYPVKTDLVSSSVVGADSLQCDALATLMFLLGHDKALDLLNTTDGLEGLVVSKKTDKVTQSKAKAFTLVGD